MKLDRYLEAARSTRVDVPPFEAVEARLEAPLPPLPSGRRSWIRGLEHLRLVIVLVAIGGALAFAGYHYGRTEAPCDGVAAPIDALWGTAAQESVTDAEMRAVLDEYARAWSAMREQNCRMTHEEGQQSTKLERRRIDCLDAQLRDFAAVVADPIPAHVAALPTVDDCSYEAVRATP